MIEPEAEVFYLMETIRDDKHWPPAVRVDNLHGDRHLFCSCAPLGDYCTA